MTTDLWCPWLFIGKDKVLKNPNKTPPKADSDRNLHNTTESKCIAEPHRWHMPGDVLKAVEKFNLSSVSPSS